MKAAEFRFNVFSWVIFISFFLLRPAHAEVTESKYFAITFYNGADSVEFAKTINAGNSFRMESLHGESKDINSIIAQSVDNLYLEVSDVLDIHMYSYRVNIKVFRTKEEMLEVAFSNCAKPDPSPPFLYIPSDNTIYVSLKHLSLGAFSHEIAHAIISNYFVTPPPAKVQEILAGYVEYSVRKRAGDLIPSRR